MKKYLAITLMLIIVLSVLSTFSSLALNSLDKENVLLKRELTAVKTDAEKTIKNLGDDLGKAQRTIAAMDSDISNKAEKKELEETQTYFSRFEKDAAETRQDVANLENKIFEPAAIYAGARKSVVSINGSTGFLFRNKTQIVTVYHALNSDPGTMVMVVPNDGTHLFVMGEIKKVRPEWDLAIIELVVPLNADPLAPASISAVGERVLVIGNTNGLNNSVSTGVISGVNRELHELPSVRMLQFDAAISFGNSGGPIIDNDGKVIGLVNRALDNFSFGFATPIDYVQRLLDEK